MEFFEVVKKRRAVRMYTADPVDREDILKILEAAHCAPSGRNTMAWEFLVVTGEKKAQLGESYGRVGVRYTADWEDRSAAEAFQHYSRTFGDAPVMIVVLAEQAGDATLDKMYLETGCAAMENIMLAAAALNLGTCWMTGPLQEEADIRRILDIPDDKQIVALTPLGHPLSWPDPPPFPVPDFTTKIHWIE